MPLGGASPAAVNAHSGSMMSAAEAAEQVDRAVALEAQRSVKRHANLESECTRQTNLAGIMRSERNKARNELAASRDENAVLRVQLDATLADLNRAEEERSAGAAAAAEATSERERQLNESLDEANCVTGVTTRVHSRSGQCLPCCTVLDSK